MTLSSRSALLRSNASVLSRASTISLSFLRERLLEREDLLVLLVERLAQIEELAARDAALRSRRWRACCRAPPSRASIFCCSASMRESKSARSLAGLFARRRPAPSRAPRCARRRRGRQRRRRAAPAAARPRRACASVRCCADRAGHLPEAALDERVDVVVDALRASGRFARHALGRADRAGGAERGRASRGSTTSVPSSSRSMLSSGSSSSMTMPSPSRAPAVAELHELVDVLEQLAERDRLVDVVFGARAQLAVLLERLVARLARHDDERDVLELRVLLQLVADREAVHARQLDRQQDQIGLVGRGLLQARVAVVDDGRRATELRELASELGGEGRVTLEHQHFRGHVSSCEGSQIVSSESRGAPFAPRKSGYVTPQNPVKRAEAPRGPHFARCAAGRLFPHGRSCRSVDRARRGRLAAGRRGAGAPTIRW